MAIIRLKRCRHFFSFFKEKCLRLIMLSIKKTIRVFTYSLSGYTNIKRSKIKMWDTEKWIQHKCPEISTIIKVLIGYEKKAVKGPQMPLSQGPSQGEKLLGTSTSGNRKMQSFPSKIRNKRRCLILPFLFSRVQRVLATVIRHKKEKALGRKE